MSSDLEFQPLARRTYVAEAIRTIKDMILDGAVTMTIEDETTTLEAGDTVVVNRGLEHELHSEHGVTFMEALAPVPLDHVPDRSRDLVLGPDGGATHVER